VIGTSLDPTSFFAGFLTALALLITLSGFILLAFSFTDKRGLSERRHRRESLGYQLFRPADSITPAVALHRDSAPARTTVASDGDALLSLPRPNHHRPRSK
jgi:hypothetical protein